MTALSVTSHVMLMTNIPADQPLGGDEGTEKHTIFVLIFRKEKIHQNFYDSGGFYIRLNIN